MLRLALALLLSCLALSVAPTTTGDSNWYRLKGMAYLRRAVRSGVYEAPAATVPTFPWPSLPEYLRSRSKTALDRTCAECMATMLRIVRGAPLELRARCPPTEMVLNRRLLKRAC